MTDQRQEAPFGYFRADPGGWTDCAPDDDGAIPLYERPQSARIAELEADVERLRVDAERYRLIRDVAACDEFAPDVMLHADESLDSYIDAARAKQASGGYGTSHQTPTKEPIWTGRVRVDRAVSRPVDERAE